MVLSSAVGIPRTIIRHRVMPLVGDGILISSTRVLIAVEPADRSEREITNPDEDEIVLIIVVVKRAMVFISIPAIVVRIRHRPAVVVKNNGIL